MAKRRKRKESNSSSVPKREVYVVFAGGGAKAIIHVGALNYLEANYKIMGVAGASAGAVVAALKASGFSANDIFQPSTPSTPSSLLSAIQKRERDVKNVSDLFGSKDFKNLKRLVSTPWVFIAGRLKWTQILLLIVSLSVSIVLPHVISMALGAYISSPLRYAALILLTGLFLFYWMFRLVPLVFSSAAKELLSNGAANTSRAVKAIVHQISVKLNVTDREVLMGDFKMPIKIIAANVDASRAEIFSNEFTPNVSLFDALSASICIPVAFPPHQIGGKIYYDGGLVSNLPAYAFSEEHYLYPERKLIALSIRRESPKVIGESASSKFFAEVVSSAKKIYETLLEGSQLLAHASMDVAHAELPTKLRLLDFDLTYEQAKAAHEQGETFAEKVVKQVFDAEDIYTQLCQILATQVEEKLLHLNAPTRRGGEFVRVAIADQAPGALKTLRIRFGVGFDGKADNAISIPIEGSVCGRAWRTKKFAIVIDASKIKSDLSEYRHISGRIDRDIQWILAVPILDADTGLPRFVVNIDSNCKLNGFLDSAAAERERALSALADIVDLTETLAKWAVLNIDNSSRKVQ